MSPLSRWLPASMLVFGAVFTVWVDPQRSLPLQEPLAQAVPLALAGYDGRTLALGDAERQAIGVSAYLLRDYQAGGPTGAQFSLYVGYYERQMRGTTIHSPKNCLPGSGWEPLTSSAAQLVTAVGPVTVNRYLLQRGTDRVLVLYWYQGRGRVASNEYWVKWELLRDAALRHRSDEALVRLVVPITATSDSAFAVASRVAQTLIPDLYQALPT